MDSGDRCDQKVKRYNDHRALLDNKDVDAVIIGTPDHWHCLQMVDACQAGKDIYVEKPVGNSITECRVMMAAQKKYNRVVQAGQWQRGRQHFKDAVDYIGTGQLGRIRAVRVWCYVGWKKPISVLADSPVPAGVDYQRWLGPAKSRPFNANRYHFTFRWFWDYAGGLMFDWGTPAGLCTDRDESHRTQIHQCREFLAILQIPHLRRKHQIP